MPKLTNLPFITPEEVLSRRLWRLRDHLMLEWKEMATLLDATPTSVAKWKNGRSMMHLRVQRRLDELERLNGLPFELSRPEKQILLKGRKRAVHNVLRRRTFVRDETIDQQPRVPWAILLEREGLGTRAAKAEDGED